MVQDQRHYYIELPMDAEAEIPRNREAAVRREQASQFIAKFSHWLEEKELNDKVASMAITALGQVQITCEKDIINRMCRDEDLSIANVRQGGTLTESLQRLGGW